MEIDKKNLKINFKEMGNKEKKEFDPLELVQEKEKTMPIPELMQKDREKMARFMNKKIGGRV